MHKYIISTIWWDRDGTSHKRTKEYKNKKCALKYFEKEELEVGKNWGYLVTLSTKHNNPELAMIHKSTNYMEN